MATFHILNFGCRASQADGAALRHQLIQAGLEEVASLEQAHVAVLNTCTVTAAADAEVRQLVRRIHRLNPRCRILATGCYAQRAPKEIAGLEGIAWVVGNSHKHLVGDLLKKEYAEVAGTGDKPTAQAKAAEPASQLTAGEAPRSSIDASGGTPSSFLVRIEPPSPRAIQEASHQAPGPRISAIDSLDSTAVLGARVLVGEITEEFHFAPVFPDNRTRPTLKIQDGCNARCSFCVIPSVRGKSRSLAPDTVLDQVRTLEDRGYKEVVLSGINLGSYGRDLDRGVSFLGLIERILGGTNIARIRISSIEPMDVNAALIGLVAREQRMARHFHVPLQSGCNRILRLMNRRYWADHYAERILAIRERIPDCGIGADVMVGYPGETDEDHAASVRFIESLPFTYLHIFPYSARPGTPAAARTGQVNGRIARERSQEIRSVIAQKRREFLAAQVGRRIPSLTIDETEADGRVALTTNYLKAVLPGNETPSNRLVNVWIGRVGQGLLHGYAEESSTVTC